MIYTYLASPYSHQDEGVRLARYIAVAKAAGELMMQGEVVFCPITHSHQIGIAIDLPTDYTFWMKQDTPFLAHAGSIAVLTLRGWKESRGVTREVAIAKNLGIPVRYIDGSKYE